MGLKVSLSVCVCLSCSVFVLFSSLSSPFRTYPPLNMCLKSLCLFVSLPLFVFSIPSTFNTCQTPSLYYNSVSLPMFTFFTSGLQNRLLTNTCSGYLRVITHLTLPAFVVASIVFHPTVPPFPPSPSSSSSSSFATPYRPSPFPFLLHVFLRTYWSVPLFVMSSYFTLKRYTVIRKGSERAVKCDLVRGRREWRARRVTE